MLWTICHVNVRSKKPSHDLQRQKLTLACREASEHFGNCLLTLLPEIAKSDGTLPFNEQADLPAVIKGAVITDHGSLTPNFKYINSIRSSRDRADTARGFKRTRQESFTSISLFGHLFDSGAINKILDVIEESHSSCRILDFQVGSDQHTPTKATLQLFAPSQTQLSDILEMVQQTAAAHHAIVSVSGKVTSGSSVPLPPRVPAKLKHILLLGAGFVTPPLVGKLCATSS